MNCLNSTLVEGNLVRDPEGKKVGDKERMVCKFPIGINRYYRNAQKELIQESVFLDIETWGMLAENCLKYLQKGRGVRVIGRLKQDTWLGKEDGKNHSKIVLLATHVEFKPDGKDKPAEEDDLIGIDDDGEEDTEA